MAEIDIDKLLERKEQSEKKDFIRSNIPLIAGVVIAAVIIIVAAAAISTTVSGKKSSVYFPVNPGTENTYNVKGKSFEKWSFTDKIVSVDGKECRVLNRVNQTNFSQEQEYYCETEEGYARAGFSSNFGKVRKSPFVMLPLKYKKGQPFKAAVFQGKEVSGTVEEEGEKDTAAGTFRAIKVKYEGRPYIDKTIWYAKGLGIIQISDRIKKEEISIISTTADR